MTGFQFLSNIILVIAMGTSVDGTLTVLIYFWSSHDFVSSGLAISPRTGKTKFSNSSLHLIVLRNARKTRNCS
jgi:hypothetical protein